MVREGALAGARHRAPAAVASCKMTYVRSSLAPLGALLAVAALSACSSTSSTSVAAYIPDAGTLAGDDRFNPHIDSAQRHRNRTVAALGTPQAQDYAFIYRELDDGGNTIPAFDYTKMAKRYLRQEVAYYGSEAPGTIVVDAKRKHLYLVQPRNRAMRYGIATGKEGFGWTGNSVLQWKQKWPTWTPPAEMIERKPELKKYADGLKGSPANPLGARAMYLFKNGKDTLYRIHGTDKPHSIGKAASSGCFRMINQDVIDLYERVGTKGQVHVREYVDRTLVATR